jgi:signal transduction histidine kinase
MLDGDKSREQLLSELAAIRRRVVELESLDAARARAARMLMEAEMRYNRLFDRAPAALFRSTPAGELLDVNAALAELLGYDDPAQLLTRSIDDLCVAPGEFWRGIEHPNAKMTCRLRQANGRIISVVVRGGLVCDEAGAPLYYEGSFVPAPAGGAAVEADNLALRRAQAMGRLSEALARAEAPARVAQVALADLLDLTGGDWAAATLFEKDGHTATPLAERRRDDSVDGPHLAFPVDWFGAWPGPLGEGACWHIDDMSRAGEPTHMVAVLRQAGVGSFVSAPLAVGEQLAGVIHVGARRVGAFTAEAVDAVADMARMLSLSLHYSELRDQLQRAREHGLRLSARMLEVQEEERRRIARELHDETGQLLTGLKLALEAVVPVGGNESPLQSARDLASELMHRVRELSLALRPTVLDDLGLVPALIWQIDRYSTQTGIQVDFRQMGVDARFRPELETAAYRITQEALTNVARHAGVGEAVVNLWLDGDALMVRIEDRGKGFDVLAARKRAGAGGLVGMQERAMLLGGQFEITSARGKGTRVLARLPLQASAEASGPAWPDFDE